MLGAPKESDIQNVFAMNEPQHMLSKLLWEIDGLNRSLSVWTRTEGFPTAIFAAFNTAVTAWHITDWLWLSRAETREALARRFNLDSAEVDPHSLSRFQDAVAADCRALYVCREIAHGSKHMRRTKFDHAVKASAHWYPVLEKIGRAEPGDLVMSLTITDGERQRDAERFFIDAFAYWENLFNAERLISEMDRLPDVLIKAEAARAENWREPASAPNA